MKKFLLIILSLTNLLFVSCENDDDDDDAAGAEQIKAFVYRGLNAIYLYKDEAPDLADDRFTNSSERNSFINQGGTPEAFFEKLTVSKDRFSFIINDFERLERFFEGVSLSTGMKFNLRQKKNGIDRYIVVTDIVKGDNVTSPAQAANIKRGMVFNRINGNPMTVNNTATLFRSNTFTIGEAKFEGDALINVENEISLTPVEVTENPIALAKTITNGAHKIGYLQYNGFVANFEEQLNDKFAKFKTDMVTDFVLDLRYNGGGAIITANALSGMITGEFGGEIFSKRQWNKEIQQQIQNESPDDLIDNFVTTTRKGTLLNILGLKKLYVITSKSQTASASELVINSLSAYIDVIVIGSNKGTVGKSQASNTLYDSASLSKKNINTAHKYAMQPLIFRTVNKNDLGIPESGILPTITAVEDDRNLGTLGEPNEPLLKIAIDNITGKTTPSVKKLNSPLSKIIGNESMFLPTYQRMYSTLNFFN